jgi:GNAT superfamily N-acetyltransferase
VVQLDSYVDLGRVLVARDEDGRVVGHLQLVDADDPATVEVKNMAVALDEQGRGIGRAMIERAIEVCREEGRRTLTVSTGAADVGNLRFYQRVGFRMVGIGIDAFTPETGYPEPIVVDGIELRDRVDFAMSL